MYLLVWYELYRQAGDAARYIPGVLSLAPILTLSPAEGEGQDEGKEGEAPGRQLIRQCSELL